MNKVFVTELLKRLPAYRVTQHNFMFETPFDHILAGFAWERPRGRIYIWKYAFPLFEDFKTMHLGYGNRLPPPDNSLIYERGAEKNLASAFAEKIEPYRSSVSKLRNLAQFIQFLESEPERFENPLLRRGYALALLMIGRDDLALKQLYVCLDATDDPKLKQNVAGHILSMERGDAVPELIKREKEMRTALGIS